MSIIFISDLHLDENHSDTATIFLRFLKHNLKKTDTLFILGDFFEMWIGDDNLTSFNLEIINALKQTTLSGIPVFFQHGNRDFLLGKKFFTMTGCKLLPEECVIDIYGEPTLLMHGDTLCIEDINYLKGRKKVRNWFLQKLFLLKSLSKRQAIADSYRARSKAYTSTAADDLMDVTQSEIVRLMQKYNVKHLIHGHTHRQAVHEFTINSIPVTRTVLGAWHGEGNALVCNPHHDWTFIKLC